MIQTTSVSQKQSYFPLGNTPAVSLTADLPPEQEADILLLGCGDVRNVLFTCYVDVGRKIDVTCCDIEPLIQARNVLLYSLLMEDTAHVNIECIWNVYYHWKLDKNSMELLENHTQKLLQVSESIDQWHGSIYGTTIRFCDTRSLSCVRSHWKGFCLRGLSNSEKANRISQLQAAVDRVNECRGNHYKNQEISLFGLSAATPVGFGLKVGEDMFEVSTQWRECGTMPSSKASALKSTRLNPAFFYSPDSILTLNPTIEPLIGIPIGTAYAPIAKGSAFCLDHKGASSTEYLMDNVKTMFRQWASAFRRAVANKLVIRIFCGDALAFCFTLRSCQLTQQRSINLPCDNWTMNPLELYAGDYGNDKSVAPLSFDIVDTSNLVDLLGPLNLIPISSTLLKYHASSTLYTELLIQRDADLISRLNDFLGVDARSMSLLLGLVIPNLFTNAVNNFEEDPVVDALLELPENQADGFARSRLRWKRLQGDLESSSFPHIHVEAKALAEILLQVHHAMFLHEDLMEVFLMQWDLSTRPGDFAKRNSTRYNRASFAALLSFLKTNVVSDWDQCVEIVYNKILSANSFHSMTLSYVEDLFLHMHLYGVDNGRFQRPVPTDLSDSVLVPKLPTKDVPEHLCVTIRVSRKTLKIFSRKTRNQMGCPTLACSFVGKDSTGTEWAHSFSTVRIAFGTWHEQTKEENLYPFIDEDISQLSGSSDMFVSVMIPTKVLLKSKLVRCELIRTPQTVRIYSQELLDPPLCFGSHKMTGKNVFITPFLPGMSACPTFAFTGTPRNKPTSTTITLQFKIGESKISTLIQRVTLESQTAKDKLAIPSSTVEINFKSPLTAFVTIAQSETLEFNFPVPVSPSKYRVRIARKSSYIEIETPLFNPLAEDAASFLFPISMTKTPCGAVVPTLWTSSRIDLDAMPILDLEDKCALSWLIGHSSLMFSNRERHILEANMKHPCLSGVQNDNRPNLKDGLFSIFMHYVGLKCQQADFFALLKTNGGIQTLIFPSCLRLDLVNHTVVLDTALVPLTKTVLSDPQAAQFIQELINSDLCQVKVSEAEDHAWKAMMPALVERCRTAAAWKHTPGCEYIQAGEVPLPRGLSEDGVSPICFCGVGKFPSEDYLLNQMKRLPDLSHMINRYATRAAIAPIFAVPYVEDCSLKDLSDKMDSMDPCPTDVLSARLRRFGINRGVYNKEKCILKEKCVACGKKPRKNVEAAEEQMLLCSKCKLVEYCSTKCQKADWKTHKIFCSIFKLGDNFFDF